MAAVAALAGLAIAARALWSERPDAGAAAEPICGAPVQINDAEGTRLGCGDEPEADVCGTVLLGDGVEFDPNGLCTRHAGAMSADMRIVVGLPLDLNRASAQDLELVNGIGPKLAAAIVHDRDQNGAYGSVDDLSRVRGIKPATLKKLRPYVAVLP
jgi:competence ComEA-like helix-hairpin-helix protein